MKVFESTIEQELERLGTTVTLSELRLAITRLQESEPNQRDKVRKTRDFLGMLAERLELPGLFTLPNGRHFVYKEGDRYLSKSALPEYMTSEEAQPVADRDLIPEEARAILEEAGIVSGARTFPVDPPPEIRATPLPPADSAADVAADDAARQSSSGMSALERFANSGKGGLRNDPDEREAITELQTFLVNELGLDTGGIDGRYGSRTRAAVRRFQGSLTDVVVDGDAGPETIGKITEIRRDLARMQELVNAIEESAIPVRFKSGLAQLLERELTQEERTELQQLLDKYENFRQTFPEFQTMIFSNAENALTGATDAAPRTYNANTSVEDLKLPVEGGDAQRAAVEEYNRLIDEGKFEEAANELRDNEALGVVPEGLEDELRRRANTAPAASDTAPQQPETPAASDTAPAASNTTDPAVSTTAPAAPNAPSMPGAPEVRSAASVAADPNNTGNAEDPEAQVFVQNTPTAIRQLRTAMAGIGTDEDAIFRVISTVRNQQQWTQLQTEYQRQYRRDLVNDLMSELGGFNNNINSTDMVRYVWDPLRRIGIQQGTRLERPNATSGAPRTTSAPADTTRAMDDRTLDLVRNLSP